MTVRELIPESYNIISNANLKVLSLLAVVATPIDCAHAQQAMCILLMRTTCLVEIIRCIYCS